MKEAGAGWGVEIPAYLNTLESVLGNLRDLGNLGLYKRMIKGINILSTKHVHFDML